MKLFRWTLSIVACLIVFTSCQRDSQLACHTMNKRKAKARARYGRYQNEGLRLSSAASRYNVNYNDYQDQGAKLSSQGY